jgi:hypothetical protein
MEFTGSQIQNAISSITISPNQTSNPTIVAPIIQTANLQLTSNTISSTTLNSDIDFSATGTANINSNALVNGSLHSTGNITFDGNLQLGSSSSDTIFIAAEVDSNIIPNATNTFNLGSSANAWNNLYVNNISIVNQPSNFVVPSSLVTLTSGNIQITGNTVSTTNTSDMLISPTSGNTKITSNGLTVNINGSTWTPGGTNPVFQFGSTGEGYWNLSQSNVQFPAGNNSNYPASPVTGQMRYNSSVGYEEVYNGTAWQSVIGLNGEATATQVNDLMNIWSLILG